MEDTSLLRMVIVILIENKETELDILHILLNTGMQMM